MPQSTQQKKLQKRDGEIASRIVIIALLSVTLIGAVKWAMNVTQANAQQISGNAVRWQDNIEARVEAQEKSRRKF